MIIEIIQIGIFRAINSTETQVLICTEWLFQKDPIVHWTPFAAQYTPTITSEMTVLLIEKCLFVFTVYTFRCVCWNKHCWHNCPVNQTNTLEHSALALIRVLIHSLDFCLPFQATGHCTSSWQVDIHRDIHSLFAPFGGSSSKVDQSKVILEVPL